MKSENLICVCVCANDDFLGFILSEIHFNFSALFQQMVLLLFSHLYAQPQTFLHFFLLFCFVFGLAMSVFSHIKKIDKKGKCQRWIAPVLNCHGQPRGHWESGFHFMVLVNGFHKGILLQQWLFWVQLQAWWPLVCPQHLFCSFLPVSVF